MKYLCVKEVGWKDFLAKPGQQYEAKDLVWADGKPLPKDVVHVMVGTGGLEPIVDDDTQLAPE